MQFSRNNVYETWSLWTSFETCFMFKIIRMISWIHNSENANVYTSIEMSLKCSMWIRIKYSEKSLFIILHCLSEDRYNYLTRLIIVVYAWPENYTPCDYCRDTKFCRLEKDWKRIIFRLKSQIKTLRSNLELHTNCVFNA